MRDVDESEYVSDPLFIRAVRDGNADEVSAMLAAGVNVDGVSKGEWWHGSHICVHK